MAMTLNKDANITKSNSNISEEVLFGAPSGGSFLMDVAVDGHAELIQELTDASRDKGAYAIREAISNAFDATAKAGDLSLPVTVHIPATVRKGGKTATLADKLAFLGDSTLYASIEDRGVGMTADELRENFAQYGNSDKRGSGAIGSKGLGSKAPLACSDFFEVTSTKDGITTRMLLWREEGGNYAKVVSEKRTRQHSGTTVRIPVSDEETRFQMERQLILIAGWNTRFDLVATVGSNSVYDTTLEGKGSKRCVLGTSLGYDYTIPMSYSASRWRYSWERPSASFSRFVYIGKVRIGQSSAGEDVLVDVWRSYDGLRGDVNDADGFGDNASIDINLMGVRYPLLRNGSVGSSESMDSGYVDYIVGCEPGYLNFTVSRDDIKEDDAWRRFVSSLREGIAAYDQRPAVVEHIRRCIAGARSRYAFIRRNDIEFHNDGNGYTLAGLPVSDADATALFSVRDDETGEVLDLAPLMAMGKTDGGTIRVLHNNRGDMFGITDKQMPNTGYYYGRTMATGYVPGTRHLLNPKEIRLAVAEAIKRDDCAAVLSAVADRHAGDTSTCDGLDLVILTNVGEGCGRIATADKAIRKYVCEKGRPADVSMMYVLCEGDYEPTDAEKVILGWFSSCTTSDFDAYIKECKSGVLLREKKAAEERRKAELEARMRQTYRLPVACAPGRKFVQHEVLAGIADHEDDVATIKYEYINPYSMTAEDIMVIFNEPSDWKRNGIAYAWALMEATGAVHDRHGHQHKRLVFVSDHLVHDMGLDQMGQDRKFDILFDSTHTFKGLMPDGIGFETDGTVSGAASDFGIGGKSYALTAAMLRCDKTVYRQAIGAFYRIVGTTGNTDLDAVLAHDELAERWTVRRNAYYYVPKSDKLPIRILPSRRSKGAYDSIRSTASRLTELWDKGISSIAEPAVVDKGAYDLSHHSLPGHMPYVALKEAMASLV